MYNESKVKEGCAVILSNRNLPFEIKSFKDKISILNILADYNHRVKNKSIHIILSFSQKDMITNETMIQVAVDYLTSLGFGQQPAFLYKHQDTATPHLHIVTTPVKMGGEKIDTSFIKVRSNQIRKDLESKYNLVIAEDQKKEHDISQTAKGSRQYKQIKLKEAMEKIKFSSLNAYFDYMSFLKIDIEVNQFHKSDRKEIGLLYQFDQDCKPIKASNLYMKPTAQRISARVAKQEQRQLNSKYDRILASPEDDIYLIINDLQGTITRAEDIDITKQVLKDIYLKSILNPKINKSEKVDSGNPIENKRLPILISRLYQSYKKENKIYYESTLINHFPSELFTKLLCENYLIPFSQAWEAVNDFYQYKLSQRERIKAKEGDYFGKRAVNGIQFVNRLPIDYQSKHIVLNKLGIKASSIKQRVHSVESELVGFNLLNNKEIINHNKGTCKISPQLNDDSIKYLKEWFESGKPPSFNLSLDPSIILLLENMGHLSKKHYKELELEKEHLEIIIAQMPAQYEFDQEKFLRETNVNRVRQMRRSR